MKKVSGSVKEAVKNNKFSICKEIESATDDGRYDNSASNKVYNEITVKVEGNVAVPTKEPVKKAAENACDLRNWKKE